VLNPDGAQARRSGGFRVLDPANELNDDFFSSRDQLWLNPLTPRANATVELGLIVQRQGGKQALENVPVAFRALVRRVGSAHKLPRSDLV
jgi:hypothetical protein